MCKARHKRGGQFSSFDFACVFACLRGKSKCAKLGIAKTGFSNPTKSVGKKKLKTAMMFDVCFYFARVCKLFYKTFRSLKSLGALLITDGSFALCEF
jgi:hypothetical protein